MRYILIILVFLSVGANAQMIIKAHANYRPYAQPAANLLLDDYPGAAAAYSLRKLDKDYTGAAIRVRKDTTGQPEQDIGFTASGDLDTAQLKQFLNLRSGFVTVWYDQSGNGRNLLESTQANQPSIANLGIIYRENGKPHVRFDGSNDRLAINNNLPLTNQTIFACINLRQNYTASTSQNIIWRSDTIVNDNPSVDGMILGASTIALTNERISWLATNLAGGSPYGVGEITTDISSGNHLISAIYNFSTLAVNINRNSSVLSLTNTTTGSFNQSTGYPRAWRRIGSSSTGSNCLQGGFFEFIIYTSNQSSNRTGIESNINTYYGIY